MRQRLNDQIRKISLDKRSEALFEAQLRKLAAQLNQEAGKFVTERQAQCKTLYGPNLQTGSDFVRFQSLVPCESTVPEYHNDWRNSQTVIRKGWHSIVDVEDFIYIIRREIARRRSGDLMIVDG